MPAIPEGFSSITPTIVASSAAEAIDLYSKAFGAQELYRMAVPDTGKIMHACIQIGTSKVFLCDTSPQCAAATVSNFYVYMEDVDVAFRQAKSAGLQATTEPQDMFWGDRMGNLKDRFGNIWTLATHVRDVSPQEMKEGRKKFEASMKAAKAA